GTIDDGRPQTLVLVAEREEDKKAKSNGGQTAYRLLLIPGDLLLFEELHDLRLYRAGIFPWGESEYLRELGKQRMALNVEANDRDDQLLLFERVAQLILDIRTCSGCDDRKDAVGTVDRVLHSSW